MSTTHGGLLVCILLISPSHWALLCISMCVCVMHNAAVYSIMNVAYNGICFFFFFLRWSWCKSFEHRFSLTRDHFWMAFLQNLNWRVGFRMPFLGCPDENEQPRSQGALTWTSAATVLAIRRRLGVSKCHSVCRRPH